MILHINLKLIYELPLSSIHSAFSSTFFFGLYGVASTTYDGIAATQPSPLSFLATVFSLISAFFSSFTAATLTSALAAMAYFSNSF